MRSIPWRSWLSLNQYVRFAGRGVGIGGAKGVASVRRYQKLSPCH